MTSRLNQGMERLRGLYSEGRLIEAVNLTYKLIDQFPEVSNIYLINGAINAELGRYDSAITSFNKVAKLTPGYPEIYNRIGVALKNMGNLEGAITNFRKAIELNPLFSEAYSNLGNILSDIGRFNEGISNYRKAIYLKPDFANVFYNLGSTLSEQKQYAGSITNFKKAIELDPLNVEALYNLGNVLTETGKFEEATSSYRKAIALKPGYLEAYNNLGNLLNELMMNEKALFWLKNAIRLVPSYTDSYNNIGNVLKDLGRNEASKAYYKKAIKLRPDYVLAHRNLGVIEKICDSDRQALKSFIRTLIIDPDLESAQHMVSALRGDTPASPPRGFIEGLFDDYAHRFDQHLIESLGYEIPELLRKLHDRFFPKTARYANVVDLGCGTGLSGVAFSDISEKLVGIDLSKKMIEQARKKDIYFELIAGDLIEKLSELVGNNLSFNLFICTDVLVYIGDCKELFSLIRKLSSHGSIFVFSIEEKDGDGFSLLNTGRYAHSQGYIRGLAKEMGYKIIVSENAVIRSDKGSSIGGNIFLAQLTS